MTIVVNKKPTVNFDVFVEVAGQDEPRRLLLNEVEAQQLTIQLALAMDDKSLVNVMHVVIDERARAFANPEAWPSDAEREVALTSAKTTAALLLQRYLTRAGFSSRNPIVVVPEESQWSQFTPGSLVQTFDPRCCGLEAGVEYDVKHINQNEGVTENARLSLAPHGAMDAGNTFCCGRCIEPADDPGWDVNELRREVSLHLEAERRARVLRESSEVENRDLATPCKLLKAENEQLRSNLEATQKYEPGSTLKTRIKWLEAELSANTKAQNRIREERDDALHMAHRLEDEVEALKKDAEKAEGVVDDAHGRVHQLEAEVADLQERIANICSDDSIAGWVKRVLMNNFDETPEEEPVKKEEPSC